MPDLTGKVVLVTGGYAGIGLETVRALLKKNAKVYIVGRDKAKGDRTLKKLKEELEKEEAMLSPKTIIAATVPKVISLNLRMCKSLTKDIRRVLNAAVLPQILANRLPKLAFLSRTSLVVLWKWKTLEDSVLTMTIL